MRLRLVFLVCFAAASLPAVGWSAWIAARAWSSWTDAVSSLQAAEAMGDALRLVEALSVERGALLEWALSDKPGTQDLREIAARNDALFEQAERGLRRAGLPADAASRAREILASARARVAEAIARPLAERDPGLVPAVMEQLYARMDAVEAAVAQAEAKVMQADASVGALVAIGSLAVDMRSAAGRRSTHLSVWIGGRPFAPHQVDEAVVLTGRVQSAWDRLRRLTLMVGDPPRVAAAVAEGRDGFFKEAEPIYRDLLAIAREGGAPPMQLPEWRRWTVASLAGLQGVRDAALAAAVERGEALAAAARGRLAAAAAATAAAFALAAGAAWVLLRRMVSPMQRLTAAVTRVAAGDTAAEVPDRGRRDELGAMAAAVEVFRANAVELRRTNLRFDAAISNMSHGLSMYDADERLVVVNRRYYELTGADPERVRPGMPFRAVVEALRADGNYPVPRSEDEYVRRRARVLSGRDTRYVDELRSGRTLASWHEPLPGGGWVSIFEDITERNRAEERVVHLAHHDALTGLPNRVLFRQKLDEALERAGRGEKFAVLSIDLDRFKAVNDTLGHPVGDGLLRAVTERLRTGLRATDTVARLGGDEFAVVQTPMVQPLEAAALARRLIEQLGAPYEVDGHQIVVSASVGIATAPGDGGDPDSLLKNVDLALYRAKAAGRGAYEFFKPEMGARVQTRRALEMDLRRAVAAGEFELRYQPVVDARTRRPTGFEALVRWNHPVRGLVPPGEFVPLCEEIGLIPELDEWVLRRACADAAAWPRGLRVSVNVSAAHFRGPAIADTVASALEEAELEPERLEIEVTESVMLGDTEEALAALRRIRALGVAVAMDDFGTGYSSLGYLRRFPFDRVKIDQSFVRGMGREGEDCGAIVRAVVGMCDGLGMAVTAEGVETEEQLARLVAEGLEEVQGDLFSRPVTVAGVRRLLAQSPAAAGDVLEPA